MIIMAGKRAKKDGEVEILHDVWEFNIQDNTWMQLYPQLKIVCQCGKSWPNKKKFNDHITYWTVTKINNDFAGQPADVRAKMKNEAQKAHYEKGVQEMGQ